MYPLNLHISCLPVTKITFQKGSANFFDVFIAAAYFCRFLYVREFDILWQE